MVQEGQPIAQEGQQFAAPSFSPRPQQMMGFMDALTTVYRNKYVTFSGRASRSEYWWGYLGYVVVATVLQIVGLIGAIALMDVNESLAGLAILLPYLAVLGMIIPSIAVSVRRLHDTGKSGWMLLIILIPCIGIILWLVWMIEDGQAHDNAYGSVPTNTLE
ncbi:MAG: DUF805 domain-containing protein [Candidatus Thalassarchaeaceae archaeon]|nr:DUF805 domain-containing protein [Candidatus Thalassarchaeaceae archaeon]